MAATYSLGHFSREEATARFKLDAGRDLFRQRCPTIAETSDVAAKVNEIRSYFHATAEVYEKVFDCLAGDEAFTVPPVHKLRHPLIFYYGHTACFFINKLVVAGLTERINPQFEEMFAIGVDEMSWDDLNEAHYSWPSVAAVTEYRRLVRDRVDQLITSNAHALQLPLKFSQSASNDANAFWWIVLMGCEHERIHLETASVHVRELPLRFVKLEMAAFWKRCPEHSDQAPTNALVEVEAGEVVLGRQDTSALYGWDSDYSDGTVVKVPSFKASRMLVSNAEFFHFMKDHGYETERFWDAEGWGWVQWKKVQHPWFWVRDEAEGGEWGYKLRLQTEVVPMPWDWPAEVNHLEASAFCAWKSEKLGKAIRLPTESEWLLLYDRFVGQDMPAWSAEGAPGNVNLERFASSCPVNKYPQGPFFDIVGNVWQHTANRVYPYRGYAVQPFYDDFSMPTFDGRHACMKGGAWISTGNEATRDARFAFRRHFFQMIGIRYVESSSATFEATPAMGSHVGMDPEVEAATHFAYADAVCGVPNVNVAIADAAKAAFKAHAVQGLEPRRALDLYCGAGRVSYELTTDFAEVVGSDFTARKLIPAFAMRERGSTAYTVASAPLGPLSKTEVAARDYAWAATRERACFFQADPSNLHAHMTNFDLIVAFNVLEHTHSPHMVPQQLLGRLNAGGVLLIATTFDFDATCSPQHRAHPLFNASLSPAERAAVVADMLGDAAALVGEVQTIPAAVFPTSRSSGKVASVHVMTFVKA